MKRRTRGKVDVVLRVSNSNDTFFFFFPKALKLLFSEGKMKPYPGYLSYCMSLFPTLHPLQGPYCNDSTVNGFCSFDFFFVLFA